MTDTENAREVMTRFSLDHEYDMKDFRWLASGMSFTVTATDGATMKVSANDSLAGSAAFSMALCLMKVKYDLPGNIEVIIT